MKDFRSALKRRPLFFLEVATAIVAVVAITAVGVSRGSDDDKAGGSKTNDSDSALVVANSFPVPASATVAFPDTAVDGIATKGWRAAGTLAEACSTWRESYRGWIDPGQAGSITGTDEDNRRCTLSGPKSGYMAELSLTVYGDDPTPSVVLSLRKAT